MYIDSIPSHNIWNTGFAILAYVHEFPKTRGTHNSVHSMTMLRTDSKYCEMQQKDKRMHQPLFALLWWLGSLGLLGTTEL